ncbi:DUF72 domain-containing protein [Alloacidobacterium sp.]|uniref:DUF72 domain-containing protein n=1 Tax=Alloacidobacterium sp. TaxID=2951999 RepID=UPI002D37761F|nr:DUF72 domain-containing protein [Alloacidobacterium sp.]HYK37084.1 DUF72 domain-containing protein [Alloacidobacterium sp.]
MRGTVRIGISGWTYKPWRGVFYPELLPQKEELSYAASKFPTIEINGTFYSLQRPTSFARWARETPDDFVFSVKGSRYITHIQRLRDIELSLANFFASGLLQLGKKLGPILWQFPPSFKFDRDLIESFFMLLPHDTMHASMLAKSHDPWMKGRAFTEPESKIKVRHAMEIRHKSFVTPEFIELLRKYRVALVCADTVEWPRLMDVTSDFVYCRLHGSEQLYVSGYSAALDEWGSRVATWARGGESAGDMKANPISANACDSRDVYVYFDNDAKVRAPFDALGLMARISKLL